MLSKQTLGQLWASPLVQRSFIVIISFFVTNALVRYFFANSLPDSTLLLSGILFGFITALLFFIKKHRQGPATSALLGLFSTLVATSIIVGDKINTAAVIPITFELEDAYYFLAWLIVVFCSITAASYGLSFISSKTTKKLHVSRNIWIKASLIMFVAWLPYFLAFFPGILSSDTSDQLAQALFDRPLNNHHPVLIAGFISLLSHIGLALSGNNFYAAIAFTTVAQMLLTACVLGYTVSWIATRFNNPILYKIAAAFFTIFPLIPLFAVSVGKDTFFGLAVLMLTMALYDLTISKGTLFKNNAWLVSFTITTLLVIFTRNNGIYIVIISLLTLLFTYRKYWKQAISVSAFIMISTLFIQGPVFGAFNIRLSSSSESFGVLLQQVGRTVALNGNLSEKDITALTPILPIKKWAKHYSPPTPDRLKFCYTELDACMNNAYLNEHTGDFIKTWLSIGIKNPRTYIEAFLIQSSNYWHIGSPDDYSSFESDENKYTNGSTDLFSSVLSVKIGSLIQKTIHLLRNSPAGLLMNQGFLIWTVLFVATVLALSRRYNLLIVLVPVMSIWLSLMAAGPAMSFRYSLAVFLTLPILLAIVVAYSKTKSVKKPIPSKSS